MAKSSKSLLGSSFKSLKTSQKKWRKMTGFSANKKKNFYDKYFEVPKSSCKPKKTKSSKVFLESSIKSLKEEQKKWRKKTGFPINKKKNFYDKYFENSKSTKKIKKKSFWDLFKI